MILPSGLSTYNYGTLASGKGWGPGWPNCGPGPTVTITLARSGTKLYQIHTKIARLVELISNEIERRGYPFHPGWCWGGECRAISGSNTPSNHSWFLAVDINAPANPYTSGTQHDIPDWAYAIWRAYGFGCGADYSGGKRDYMHVEFMGNPTDAAAMTALAERAFGPKPVAAATTATATPAPVEDDEMRTIFFFKYQDGRIFEGDGLTNRVVPDMDTLAGRLFMLNQMGMAAKLWDGAKFVDFTSPNQAGPAVGQHNQYVFGYDDTAGRSA